MIKLFQNKIYNLRSNLFYLTSDNVQKLLVNLNLKFLCNLQVFIFLANITFILFLYWSNKNYLASEIALLKPQPVFNVLPVHIPTNVNPEVLSSASSFWEQYGPAIIGISCVVVAGVALYIFLSRGNPGDSPVIPDTKEVLNSNAENAIFESKLNDLTTKYDELSTKYDHQVQIFDEKLLASGLASSKKLLNLQKISNENVSDILGSFEKHYKSNHQVIFTKGDRMLSLHKEEYSKALGNVIKQVESNNQVIESSIENTEKYLTAINGSTSDSQISLEAMTIFTSFINERGKGPF